MVYLSPDFDSTGLRAEPAMINLPYDSETLDDQQASFKKQLFIDRPQELECLNTRYRV